MNAKTFFSSLRDWAKTLAWEGSSNKIFGNNVFVVPDFPSQQLTNFVSPTLLIADMGANIDASHPQLIEQSFSMGIFVENVSQNMGEGVMLSYGRSGATTSTNAGILDLEQELLKNLISAKELSDLKILLWEKSKAKGGVITRNSPSVFRAMTFSVLLEAY